MHVAFLLNPKSLVEARKHRLNKPGANILDMDKMYQASKRFFLPVINAFTTVKQERETLVSEFVDFQSSAGVFLGISYESGLDDASSLRAWWTTVATEELHKVADMLLSIRPSNQAAEHGWAALSQQCHELRWNLAFRTKYCLLHITANAGIVLDKERPHLTLLRKRRGQRAARRVAGSVASAADASAPDADAEEMEVEALESESDSESCSSHSSSRSSNTAVSELSVAVDDVDMADLVAEPAAVAELDLGFSSGEDSS